MASGTVAIGNMAKWVAASEVASPEFCIHLQRLEVETICAVVLTCDGDVLDEERWGAGVVEQVSLAMKLEFPDADGFSMYYTQGGEENTMFFRIGSKKRFFFRLCIVRWPLCLGIPQTYGLLRCFRVRKR
jgi:hypothetical protein